MPNPLPPPRSDLIIAVQDRIMEVLQEHAAARQLRPDEGLMAIELTFVTLFENAMGAAPADLQLHEQQRHLNTLTRLSSRVQAWPARALDAKQRM